ncbi:hypothetical protein CEXT_270571 [Caerostris extrusa]|uniref:Uncharacterized protein n=1 Tax=Caerostris extrusa TaxID=172846 RepID=A0AAV4SBA7_CAEEX|nr:hypothetical protein CEXT_270571 [Caerostris extrusa]
MHTCSTLCSRKRFPGICCLLSPADVAATFQQHSSLENIPSDSTEIRSLKSHQGSGARSAEDVWGQKLDDGYLAQMNLPVQF